MNLRRAAVRKTITVISAVFTVILAAGVSVAFASLNFNGTSITGDTGSSLDATGTVTIGATQATGVTIGRSGITATFPGSVTITGTTTTLQNLVIGGTCSGSGCLVPGGDLSGSGSSQTVVGLQGRAVTSTAPSANQVLTWNGTTWVPANTGSGITAINGLSNATTSIVGAGGITVSTSSPNTITITGSTGAITINSIATTTFQVQGTANQITVATSAPNIITLSLPQNIAVGSSPSFTGLTISGLGSAGSPCLSVGVGGTVATTTCGSGGTAPTINGITSSTFTFAAGSGLAVASSANPNVITYTFTNPGFPTAASSVTWTALQTFTGGAAFNSTSTHNSSTLLIGQTAVGTSTLNGALNVLGALNQAGSVVSLASTTVNGNATTTALSITGLAGTSGCLSVSASGAVTTSTCSGGAGVSPTINGITSSTFNFLAAGGILTVASSANPNNITYTWTNPGYVTAASSVTWTAAQTYNNPVTFNATATFLGPIVESSTGAGSIQLAEGTCPSGSSGNDILCANSSHALEASLNGGSFVAIPQIAGDIGGSASTPLVVGLQGNPVSSTAPSTNQVLTWNGSSWAPANASGGGSGSVTTSSPITANNFPFWANTTGGLSGTSTLSISGNTITNSGNANLGGNLNVTGTASFSATTTFLGAIQGGSPSSTEGMQIMEGSCPSAVSGSDILCANSSTHAFQTSLNGGSYFAIPQLAGDLGSTASSPTVVGLQGRAVSSTAPSTNQVLTWNGSSWAPANTGSGITAINGLSNSTTSIAAGAGISISTSSPNIITITATGGSASSSWSMMTNPTTNLSLSMGDYTTTLTYGTTTTATPFLIQDTTGNTATSSLFQVSTVGTSVASPVKFTAQGTANGVQMNSSGTLIAIGTGNINATQIQGIAVATATPSTNQVLTYNGTSWAPANASGTGGGGSGTVTTSSAITTGTFPFWTSTSGALSGTSTVSASGNTVTNSGNQQIGGTLNVTSTANLAATTTILGNVAFGTSTTNSGANMFASYGTTGTTTLMLGATTTARVGCIEMVADGGSLIDYLTFSSTGTLQYSTSTCL